MKIVYRNNGKQDGLKWNPKVKVAVIVFVLAYAGLQLWEAEIKLDKILNPEIVQIYSNQNITVWKSGEKTWESPNLTDYREAFARTQIQ